MRFPFSFHFSTGPLIRYWIRMYYPEQNLKCARNYKYHECCPVINDSSFFKVVSHNSSPPVWFRHSWCCQLCRSWSKESCICTGLLQKLLKQPDHSKSELIAECHGCSKYCPEESCSGTWGELSRDEKIKTSWMNSRRTLSCPTPTATMRATMQ